MPHSEYTDNGSTNILGRSTGGGNGGSFRAQGGGRAHFYLSHKVNDKINVGVGVFVPYGAKLDYGFDWAGRYALKSVNLQSFNINPSMSFKLDDRHSFGFGISAQYMDAKLQQMADATTGINGRLQQLGFTPAQIAAIGVKGMDWRTCRATTGASVGISAICSS